VSSPVFGSATPTTPRCSTRGTPRACGSVVVDLRGAVEAKVSEAVGLRLVATWRSLEHGGQPAPGRPTTWPPFLPGGGRLEQPVAPVSAMVEVNGRIVTRPMRSRTTRVRLCVFAAMLVGRPPRGGAARQPSGAAAVEDGDLHRELQRRGRGGEGGGGVPGPGESRRAARRRWPAPSRRIGQFGAAKVEPKLLAFVDAKKLQAALAVEKRR